MAILQARVAALAAIVAWAINSTKWLAFCGTRVTTTANLPDVAFEDHFGDFINLNSENEGLEDLLKHLYDKKFTSIEVVKPKDQVYNDAITRRNALDFQFDPTMGDVQEGLEHKRGMKEKIYFQNNPKNLGDKNGKVKRRNSKDGKKTQPILVARSSKDDPINFNQEPAKSDSENGIVKRRNSKVSMDHPIKFSPTDSNTKKDRKARRNSKDFENTKYNANRRRSFQVLPYFQDGENGKESRRNSKEGKDIPPNAVRRDSFQVYSPTTRNENPNQQNQLPDPSSIEYWSSNGAETPPELPQRTVKSSDVPYKVTPYDLRQDKNLYTNVSALNQINPIAKPPRSKLRAEREAERKKAERKEKEKQEEVAILQLSPQVGIYEDVRPLPSFGTSINPIYDNVDSEDDGLGFRTSHVPDPPITMGLSRFKKKPSKTSSKINTDILDDNYLINAPGELPGRKRPNIVSRAKEAMKRHTDKETRRDIRGRVGRAIARGLYAPHAFYTNMAHLY